MSLKDQYSSHYYATPLDLVTLFNQLVMQDLNLKDTNVIDPNDVIQYRYQLMDAIKKSSSIVESYIAPVYNGVPSVSPYASFPISNRNNDDPSAYLRGISGVGSDAVNELWKITFNSATNFTVEGDFSGGQGSGTKSTKFTSTNLDVVIDPISDSGIWSGAFAAGDIIWFNTYNRHAQITTLTSMIAMSFVIDNLFYAEVPNELNYASILYNRAIAMLKRLQDPTNKDRGGLTLGSTMPTRDLSPIQVEYDINYAGYDMTDYAADDTDNYQD